MKKQQQQQYEVIFKYRWLAEYKSDSDSDNQLDGKQISELVAIKI